jgi:transcriptional regulator with XRE-family HTH domain
MGPGRAGWNDRVRALLKEQRLSMTEAERRATGVKAKRGWLSEALKQEEPPSHVKCEALAQGLGVLPGWLVYGVGPRTEAEHYAAAAYRELPEITCLPPLREQVRFLEKAAKLRARGECGVTLSSSANMLGQWVELLANDPDFTVYVDPPSTSRQGRGGSWMDGG